MVSYKFPIFLIIATIILLLLIYLALKNETFWAYSTGTMIQLETSSTELNPNNLLYPLVLPPGAETYPTQKMYLNYDFDNTYPSKF